MSICTNGITKLRFDKCCSECQRRPKSFEGSRCRTAGENKVTATGTDQSGAREAVAAEECSAVDERERTVIDGTKDFCTADFRQRLTYFVLAGYLASHGFPIIQPLRAIMGSSIK